MTPWVTEASRSSASQALLDEAESALVGDYSMLGHRFHERPLDWHRDPLTGQSAPRTFALGIDVRDTTHVGRIKHVWEKSRHHHLTVLATAYALTRDHRYAAEVERQLLDWCAANPVMRGVNWASSLELGVRLIAWVWIERLLRGSTEHTRLFGPLGGLWDAIYWHQWFIAQHASPGSSANNHLIGEMAGLFVAATAWPVFAESPAWATRARSVLEEEAHSQTYESGLNRELAFDYHLFALEFFLLACLEAERVGAPMSTGYRRSVARQVEAIAALSDRAGNTPRFGDGDDGTALRLDASVSPRTPWLLTVGRTVVGADVPTPPDAPLTAALMMPGSGVRTDDDHSEPPLAIERGSSAAFADAGMYVLTSRSANGRLIECVADAGPLGYLSIAAHGHADALSFTMAIDGVPVIVDPGTYVYDGDDAARSYFRGTRAHNTITVDEVDQSVAGGTFMWTRKANAFVEEWHSDAQRTRLTAWHDGYTRLHGRPIHTRRLTLDGGSVRIEDDVSGTGEHVIEWRLHMPPWCDARLDHDGCRVRWDAGLMTISTDTRLDWRVASGEPYAGWYSPSFNIKQPSHTLVGTWRGALPFSIDTIIEVDGAR